jgi:hypothetical protein
MVPPVIDTGWHNNRQPNLRVAKQQISPRIGRNGGTTAGAKEERGRGWVPGGWDARRRRRRWSGGEASPALVERWRWKLWVAEGKGIPEAASRPVVSEAGPRDRGRGSVSHQLGLRPVGGQRARTRGHHPIRYPVAGTSPRRQIH